MRAPFEDLSVPVTLADLAGKAPEAALRAAIVRAAGLRNVRAGDAVGGAQIGALVAAARTPFEDLSVPAILADSAGNVPEATLPAASVRAEALRKVPDGEELGQRKVRDDALDAAPKRPPPLSFHCRWVATEPACGSWKRKWAATASI